MMFFDIIETNATDKTHPRQSSLMIGGSRQNGGMEVLGNLPHGYEFKPRRAIDRDELVGWLQRLDYPQEGNTP